MKNVIAVGAALAGLVVMTAGYPSYLSCEDPRATAGGLIMGKNVRMQQVHPT